MPHITREMVEHVKKFVKEEYDVEYSESDAWEATRNLLGFALHLIDIDHKQKNSEKQGGVKPV